MPDFYVGDLDITPSEFVEACSQDELNELFEILTDDGVIKNKYSTNNVLDNFFCEALDILTVSRHRLTNEEEEMIIKIANRL